MRFGEHDIPDPDWVSPDGQAVLYNQSCLDVLPCLPVESVESCITDPVWPNAAVVLAGCDDPYGLWKSAWSALPNGIKRVAVHLGCDSDPGFVEGMHSRWPFFRVAWLDYARPHYKGRLLYGSDVAYLFGEPQASAPGAHVVPGKFCSTDSNGRESDHPCPRKLSHVQWLVKWWGGQTIIDPFCGSAQTIIAATRMGRRAIGIEVERKYFDIARTRIDQEARQGKLW